jgi:hypothetical protein
MVKVTIVPDDDGEGLCQAKGFPKWFQPDVLTDARTKQWIEKKVLITLSGLAAQHRRDGRHYWRGFGPDLHSVHLLAGPLYEGKCLKKYLDFMVERAKCLVASERWWVQIEAVAAALLDRQTLSGREVRALCRRAWIEHVARKIKAPGGAAGLERMFHEITAGERPGRRASG